LREGSMDFINIVPRIALGVIGSGYIAAVIPQEIITGWLGPNSGWFGVLAAVIAAVSVSRRRHRDGDREALRACQKSPTWSRTNRMSSGVGQVSSAVGGFLNGGESSIF
jgi:hypothetical protein